MVLQKVISRAPEVSADFAHEDHFAVLAAVDFEEEAAFVAPHGAAFAV